MKKKDEIKSTRELINVILEEIILDLSSKDEAKQKEYTLQFITSAKKLHRILKVPFNTLYGEKDYQKIAADAQPLIDKLFLDTHFNTKTSDRVMNEVLQYYSLDK